MPDQRAGGALALEGQRQTILGGQLRLQFQPGRPVQQVSLAGRELVAPVRGVGAQPDKNIRDGVPGGQPFALLEAEIGEDDPLAPGLGLQQESKGREQDCVVRPPALFGACLDDAERVEGVKEVVGLGG